jgi:hypothetical protein
MGRSAFLLLAGLLGGCSSFYAPQQPAPWQSEALQRSAKILRQLDKLEADLHAANGETFTYSELVQRHGQTQQMACQVTDEHLQEIHRLAEAQQRKREEKKTRKRHALAQNQRHSGRTFAAR